jgi:hypothetical protein
MRIYWGVGSIPELAKLPRAERNKAWRAAYRRAFRRWQMWVALIVPIALGVVLGQLLDLHYGSIDLGSAIGAGIGGGIFGLLATAIVARDIRSGSGRDDG